MIVIACLIVLAWLIFCFVSRIVEMKHNGLSARAIWSRVWPILTFAGLWVFHWVILFGNLLWIQDFHIPAITTNDLIYRIIWAFLWLLACLSLIQSERRGEKNRTFSLWTFLLLDGWHIPGMLLAFFHGGLLGPLKVYMPIGSRPLTGLTLAYLIVYIIVRMAVAFCFLFSSILHFDARFKRKRPALGEKERHRKAALIGVLAVILPFALSVGIGKTQNTAPQAVDVPAVWIELEDLRDGVRSTYACDIEGNMQMAESFRSDEIKVITGTNVYREDYSNWQLSSTFDDPAFMDEQGNEVPFDETLRRILIWLLNKPGYAEHVRLLRDGDFWFLEVEIADSLWRPFRLYGYDGERLVLLASYDSRQLTALKVVRPEAFVAVAGAE